MIAAIKGGIGNLREAARAITARLQTVSNWTRRDQKAAVK